MNIDTETPKIINHTAEKLPKNMPVSPIRVTIPSPRPIINELSSVINSPENSKKIVQEESKYANKILSKSKNKF
jgi:hypothetical protein